MMERLQKFMAAAGLGSRRACEEFITQGRVQVDGRVVTKLGTQVDPDVQDVRFDGSRVRGQPELHYLLNKPRGAICSQVTKAGTPRAIDFVPTRARDRRLFTIGRLDVDSEGALILTNDGALCHLLTHPRFGVEKTYRVDVEGAPDDETIERMRKGIWLSEGRTGPVDIRLVHRGRQQSSLELKLNEGKRREIRRLCARFGHEVRKLTRIAIGPIDLGTLPPGEARMLRPHEIAALRSAGQAVIRLGGSPRPASRGGARGGARGESRGRSRDEPRGRAAHGARTGERTGQRGRGRGGPPSATPTRGRPRR